MAALVSFDTVKWAQIHITDNQVKVLIYAVAEEAYHQYANLPDVRPIVHISPKLLDGKRKTKIPTDQIYAAVNYILQYSGLMLVPFAYQYAKQTDIISAAADAWMTCQVTEDDNSRGRPQTLTKAATKKKTKEPEPARVRERLETADGSADVDSDAAVNFEFINQFEV